MQSEKEGGRRIRTQKEVRYYPLPKWLSSESIGRIELEDIEDICSYDTISQLKKDFKDDIKSGKVIPYKLTWKIEEV